MKTKPTTEYRLKLLEMLRNEGSAFSLDRLKVAETEISRLKDIIHRAKVKFCAEGSDGQIAAQMLFILNETD